MRILNKRFDTRTILIFTASAALIAGIFFYAAVNNTNLDGPAICAGCHEMDIYVGTFLRPDNGSILAEHRQDCLGCHSNSSRQIARNAVLREIQIGTLNRITGSNFSITSPELATNCTGCHVLKGYSHMNYTANARCAQCHWAHKPSSDVVLNPYAIPSGPHRNQTCSKCHGREYGIPRCTNCHSGHGGQKLENRLCLACHVDPHLPKIPGIVPGNTVNFTADMPFSICVPCHEKEYNELNYSRSRHLDMQTCALCHDSHGKKPRCSSCHPDRIIHGHTTFVCSTCHGTITAVRCKLCHGNSHEWSALTALRPEDLSIVNNG